MKDDELIETIADIIVRANYNSDQHGLKAANRIAFICKAHYRDIAVESLKSECWDESLDEEFMCKVVKEHNNSITIAIKAINKALA